MMTMGMWNDENGEKCLTKNRIQEEVYRQAVSQGITPAHAGNT